MADTMQFDLVSPERLLSSVQATEVQLPGAEGDMTAMPDHAATITTLRPGIVRVVGNEGTKEFLVSGGFAEISATGASVLAEQAVPREEVSQELIDSWIAIATEARESATPEFLDSAAKRVADLSDVASEVGLVVRS